MATFVAFQSFVQAIGRKVHNLNSDTLKIYLTNTQPSASGDAVKADLPTELANGNGYTTGGGTVDSTAYSQTGGTASLTGTDHQFEATGSMGPFRYAVLYNDTASNDELIGYWDYGSSVTLSSGETFTVDFGSTILTLAPA